MYLRLERKASAFIAWSDEREVSPYVQKSDFYLINVFCTVIVVKKCTVLAQVVFSYFVLHRSKIPMVLSTKVTHLHSLLFRQQDRVNSVVRRVCLAITSKLVLIDYSAVSRVARCVL